MRPWRAGNEPAAADPALELVTIQGISPIHNELKVVELSPFSIADGPCRFLRVQFIEARVDTLLFRALEVDLPSGFGIGCFRLVFW